MLKISASILEVNFDAWRPIAGQDLFKSIGQQTNPDGNELIS